MKIVYYTRVECVPSIVTTVYNLLRSSAFYQTCSTYTTLTPANLCSYYVCRLELPTHQTKLTRKQGIIAYKPLILSAQHYNCSDAWQRTKSGQGWVRPHCAHLLLRCVCVWGWCSLWSLEYHVAFVWTSCEQLYGNERHMVARVGLQTGLLFSTRRSTAHTPSQTANPLLI